MVRILIALGGNAIKQANEQGTKEEQMRNVDITAECVVRIVQADATREIVLTHGNGPQAGNLALQQDLGKAQIPPQPFDVVGAMTQGQIGYMFQNRMQNRLLGAGIHKPVVSIVNQVLVDINDPEFQGENASKPVGNFMTEEEAMAMKREKHWIVKHVKPSAPKGWRRVVPSPNPIRNIEAETARLLCEHGTIVIASGGGGIPVIQTPQGLEGVEAVIDKDLAGERLAEAVGAEILLILTDVPSAVLNYGKPNAQPLVGSYSLEQMKAWTAEGHFHAGSMGPKVKACLRHVERGGREAIITSLDKAAEALAGHAGTHIHA